MSALERLTAAALDEQIRAGTTIAVIPFGSIEHHGAHLPLGADSLLADAVGASHLERFIASVVDQVAVRARSIEETSG